MIIRKSKCGQIRIIIKRNLKGELCLRKRSGKLGREEGDIVKYKITGILEKDDELLERVEYSDNIEDAKKKQKEIYEEGFCFVKIKKKCSICEEFKKVSKFHKNITVKNGHRNKCKDCRRIDSLKR